MDYSDKTITMNDGRVFIVIEQVEYENNTYLYLVNDDDDTDSVYLQIKDDKLLKIDPKLFEEKIFPLFYNKIND